MEGINLQSKYNLEPLNLNETVETQSTWYLKPFDLTKNKQKIKISTSLKSYNINLSIGLQD